MIKPSGRRFTGRICAYALGSVLFVIGFLLTVVLTLPGETALGLIAPSLEAGGIHLTAEKTRLTFPLGVRLENATLSTNNKNPIHINEVTASWEWTGLFRWLPSRLRAVNGNAVADIHLSPAFWSPSRGHATLTEVSSEELAFQAFSDSGTKFSIRQAQAQWRRSGSDLAASGSVEFDYLLLPVSSPESPIREVRIDNVSFSFVANGSTLHIPNMQGSYEGARVDGTGEIARFLSSGDASITFHLTIHNLFKGRVGMLFDILAKNAKSVTLRITGSPAAPKVEFLLF